MGFNAQRGIKIVKKSILLKEGISPQGECCIVSKNKCYLNLQLRGGKKKGMSSKWNCKYMSIACSNSLEKGELYLNLRLLGML